MQFTTFTHGKCNQCGYLALLDKFENKRVNETKQIGHDGFTAEMFQLVVVCPMCGNENCLALFPNEVN
jgi:predicted nucleic-acid-binding Zn-ribbon protein